ncbi:unnamed protein product [Arctogadus glacialis]
MLLGSRTPSQAALESAEQHLAELRRRSRARPGAPSPVVYLSADAQTTAEQNKDSARHWHAAGDGSAPVQPYNHSLTGTLGPHQYNHSLTGMLLLLGPHQ